MVDHQTHCQNTKALLGRDYAELHHWMDKPSSWKIPTLTNVNILGVKLPTIAIQRLGPRHRIHRHDIPSIMQYAIEKQDYGALFAGLIHLRDDGLIRDDPFWQWYSMLLHLINASPRR